MAQRYVILNSGVSSISCDGIEHHVDPETGELVVEVLTPNLAAELQARGATLVAPPGPRKAPIGAALSSDEQKERDALFLEMDTATGSRVDRRRSLQQLREMKTDIDAAGKAAADRAASRTGTSGDTSKAP